MWLKSFPEIKAFPPVLLWIWQRRKWGRFWWRKKEADDIIIKIERRSGLSGSPFFSAISMDTHRQQEGNRYKNTQNDLSDYGQTLIAERKYHLSAEQVQARANEINQKFGRFDPEKSICSR